MPTGFAEWVLCALQTRPWRWFIIPCPLASVFGRQWILVIFLHMV